MNAKHRPGPWSVERPYGEPGVYVTAADPRKTNPLICRIYEESEGCANLIAAAPELLEACQRALPWIGKMIADGAHMHSVAPNDCVGAMEQMQAAIAKATGGVQCVNTHY